MNQDFMANLRSNVQASLGRDKVTAGAMFREIIQRPPEPNPMEVWQEYISKSSEEHAQQAQLLGPEEFLKQAEDMLTLGEQLIGPQARQLMPYLEQFATPPAIAESSPASYSPLIDQALAEVENYGSAEYGNEPLQP